MTSPAPDHDPRSRDPLPATLADPPCPDPPRADAPSLRDRLRIGHLARQPDAEAQRLRRSLVRFLRQAEPRIFTAPPAVAEEIRGLFGWDERTLAAFVEAPLVTHSSPHASMNLFAPNLAHPWMHAAIQRLIVPPLPGGGRAIHLRTQLTYNNLSDARYRPAVWWHRDREGRAARTVLFSRSRRTRHQVLLAQPVPDLSPEGAVGADAEALRLARHARSFASFAMIYRAAIERAAGLHEPGGVIEAPLHLVSEWTFAEEDLEAWARAFAAIHEGAMRTLAEDGTLRELDAGDLPGLVARARVDPDRSPILCPTFMVLALVGRLGIALMTGGAKMARYFPDARRVIEALYRGVGESHPLPELLPISRIPVDEVAPADPETARQLAAEGALGALAIAVHDHGPAIRARLDALLDRLYADVFPPPEA